MSKSIRFISIILLTALNIAFIPLSASSQDTVGERIYVLGAVNKPGDFEYRQGIDVKEALELAGGPTPNADPNGAILARANSDEKIVLNIKSILEGKEKIALEPGDTIAVKPATFRVEGQVKQPGTFDLMPGMTANDAIRVSGGATETAALAQAFVTRNGEQISARLNTISSTLPLEPNDVLTVPEFTASITGEVNKPGTYVLMPAKNATLAGLIEQAGGITEKAGLKKIRISTLQGSESQTQTVDASNPEILQSSKINSGDVVFIPEAEARKRHRISFKSVSQAALMLYTLFQVLSD